jgi:hypothetical protein
MGLPTFQCKRCRHCWHPRTNETPVKCPKCGSPYWDRERQSPQPPPGVRRSRATKRGSR